MFQRGTDDRGRQIDLNWITSVDDHIIEPPNVWQDRVPAKYKDVAPRVIIDDSGTEVWAYEDIRQMTGGLGASAGAAPSRSRPSASRTPRCARAVTTPRPASRT